jgi:hypothetical protein
MCRVAILLIIYVDTLSSEEVRSVEVRSLLEIVGWLFLSLRLACRSRVMPGVHSTCTNCIPNLSREQKIDLGKFRLIITASNLIQVWRLSFRKGPIHRAGGDLVLLALTPDWLDLHRGWGLGFTKLDGSFWQDVGNQCYMPASAY